MCGFCGYVEKQKITNDKQIFKMVSALTDSGQNTINVVIKNNVALGHSKSDTKEVYRYSQPITRTINGNCYTIVYNGKVFNYDEIKLQLMDKGYDFFTTGDAELVLLAYIEYKEKCLKLLNGNYAFAILDNETLILARDRLGVKPLFYYNQDSFIFASEIKSILKHDSVKANIGKDEICEIFGLGPAHTPGKTFFKDIFEILPGHYAIVQNGNISTHKYWDLETKDINDTIEESITKIKGLVTDSLNRQIISNVPVCSMLSGGLDSSVLAYLASKKITELTTFSIDFEGNKENFVESDYQPTRDSDYVKKMQEHINSNHTDLYFSTEEILETLKDAMIARDMPGMADVDSSMLIFCKKIRETGYTVAISGECSDEIFGGYPWYYKEKLINSLNFPWSRAIMTRKSIVNNNIVSGEYLLNYIDNAFKKSSSNVVFNSLNEQENTFRKTCYNTIKWFMNTLIERTDRMSMLSGLEVRVPFADYRIFEYVYNLSAKYKLGLVNGNEQPIEKYLLRKAFEKDLPNDVVYRKKSQFPKTYDPKYTELLENQIKNIINKSTSPILEIINVKFLYEILETKGKNLSENWFGQLMTYPQTLAYLIQVNMWLKEYNIDIEI